MFPPPLKGAKDYHPKLGKTGLYYWGRKVMIGHNFPADDIFDGFWGPNDGPNCHAWRTIRTDKMDELNDKGIFQGYSGMIYCGKMMEVLDVGHEGNCGPNNGPSCDSCYSYLFDKYHKSSKNKA